MKEQRISGNIVFQSDRSSKDGGFYFIENEHTCQRVGICTRNLDPDDLREMAEHLEKQRLFIYLGH